MTETSLRVHAIRGWHIQETPVALAWPEGPSRQILWATEPDILQFDVFCLGQSVEKEWNLTACARYYILLYTADTGGLGEARRAEPANFVGNRA